MLIYYVDGRVGIVVSGGGVIVGGCVGVVVVICCVGAIVDVVGGGVGAIVDVVVGGVGVSVVVAIAFLVVMVFLLFWGGFLGEGGGGQYTHLVPHQSRILLHPSGLPQCLETYIICIHRDC